MVESNARLGNGNGTAVALAKPSAEHERDVALSPSGSLDRQLAKPATIEWRCEQTFSDHELQVHGIAVHPTSNVVATASWDRTSRLHDIANRSQPPKICRQDAGMYAVQFAKSNPRLLGTASSDNSCCIWDWETQKTVLKLEGHKEEVNDLAFHGTEHVVATASDDMSVKLWDIESANCIRSLLAHKEAVYGVAFWPADWTLASVSFDYSCIVWDARQPQPIETVTGHHDEVIGVDIMPSATILATGSDDGTCRIWDVRTWRCIEVLSSHEAEVKRVRFSPDGNWLATSSGDKSIKVWSTARWQLQATLVGHTDHVFDIGWLKSPFPGLVSASHDKTWRYWSRNELVN